MKKNFEHKESRGLPGGPNEYITHISAVFSTEGYKRNSPDVNNPYNIIPSGDITMEGVDFPVKGTDNLGNEQMMMPGMNYQFPGDQVFEIPMAKRDGGGVGDPPDSGNNAPNRNDSIAVMNSALAQEEFYKNYKKKGPYKYNIPVNSWLYEMQLARTDFLNSPSTHTTEKGLQPVSFDEYYKKIDDNKFKQRELANGILSLNAPMGLYDRRISPQSIAQYRDDDGVSIKGDHVTLAKYDPLAVTPWDMLDDDQQQERLDKYGASGTPFDSSLKPKGTTDPNISVDVRFRNMGINPSFANRKKVAMEEMGMEKYLGTPEQNKALNLWVQENYTDQGERIKAEALTQESEFTPLPTMPLEDIEITTSTPNSLIERPVINTTKRYDKNTGKWIEGSDNRSDYEAAIDKARWEWAQKNKFANGGSTSWNWKGKSYSGTLIPSMETENNRYARTQNGKIKTLPKAQDGTEITGDVVNPDSPIQLDEVTVTGYDRDRLTPSQKIIYDQFISDKVKIQTEPNPNYDPNVLNSPRTIPVRDEEGNVYRTRFKPTTFLYDDPFTQKYWSGVDGGGGSGYKLDIANAMQMLEDSGVDIQNTPSFMANLFKEKYNITEDPNNFRAHAGINDIYVPKDGGMQSIIAEMAHVMPGLRETPTLSGTWDRIKRAWEEGDVPDSSNYTSPKDFEYKTHTGSGSVEKKILDKYFKKYQTGGEYRVQSGNTFDGIANKLGIDKQALREANPGIEYNTLKLNQIIKLPVQDNVQKPEETSWGDYLNPMNWGVSDRDDDGDFKQAFRAAREAGEDEFMWYGERYTTELDKTVVPKKEELVKKEVNDYSIKEYQDDLKDQENLSMKGWDPKKQLWFPTPAPEKNGGYDIGYGHKIKKGESFSKGLTNDQVNNLFEKDIDTKFKAAKSTFNNRNLSRSWDELDQQEQLLLTDYQYNGVLGKFKNFMKAVADKDKDLMLKEYVRYDDGVPLGKRNDWTKSYIDNKINYKKGGEPNPLTVYSNYQYAGEIPIRERAVAIDNTNYVNPNIRFFDEEYIEDAPKPVTAPITEPILNPNKDVKSYQDLDFINYQPKFIDQVAESTAVVLPYQAQLDKALTPEAIAEWQKDQEIAGTDFVDLKDSISSKFITSVNEYGKTVYKDYSNKPEEEVKELQQSLIAEGYDVGSTKDDGVYGSKTQKAYNAFVEDKNLNLGSIDRYYKKYSGSNKDEVIGIQTKLIEEGFLPVENEYGRANADGKFGERTKNALQEYNTSQEEEDSNALIFDFIPSTLDETRCAAGMCTILENNNIQTESIGVKYKDAWDIFDNMKTAGNSEVIFNIYDEPEFDNISKEMSVSELKAKTNSVKSRKQTKKSDYKVGDIIGIYWPGSNKHEETLKKDSEGDYLSKTYNTHTGFVSDIDEEGNPIITHNVGGNIRQQPYTQLQTAWISRPNKNIKLNRTYEVPELPIPEVASNVILNLEQKWGASIPDSRVPVIQNIVARADYNAGNIPQMLNSSVDPDWLRAATVAITGVESGVGKDDVTSRTIDQARNTRGGLTGLAYDYKGKKETDISLGIGKVKFSTIDNFAKEFFNINSVEDLADDNKSIDVISYRLTKNYELFKDYAKQYPQLGLTDTDIKNMSILSHNQGNNKLLMIGRNNENNLSADKEIKELRKLYKGTINDVSSTNYRFLPSGEEIYNTALWAGFESEAKPYIRKVNDYMQEVFPSNETVINPNAIANNEPSTKPFAKVVMAKGGEYGVFNNYINGDYDNTPREKYASDLYDKLNRIHYKDAKALNMSPANYILTHILNKA
tara:strand:+ start:3195 stop:8552 length:5358 start_codon:yes stop_codon:yes gene_type:complete